MTTKSKSSKSGGATFGYVDQFNYPLSPCYKNTVKAGWHSGGSCSCSKKTVEGLSYKTQLDGGGFFDWLFGDIEEKKTKKSKSAKSAKSVKSTDTSEKKKKTSVTKKKPSKK